MTLLTPGATVASRQYIFELERAYTQEREVWDPDYALSQDPDVYQVIGRDPETSHAIQQRKHLVAGSRWRVTPASDTEADRRAAAVMERLLGKIRMFTLARFQLADAVFRGSAWAFIEGRKEPLAVAGGAEREWWVPTRLQPVDKRRFRQWVRADKSVCWQLYSIERRAWEDLDDRRRWFVRVAYDQAEETFGYGRGLVGAIYHWQYAKAKVLADGLDGLERWAHGVLSAKVDGLRKGDALNSELLSAWLTALDSMRSRHAIAHDKQDEIELIESSGQGHEMVKDFLSYLRDGIRVLILGANLPTSANSGGSYALAEVQENSTEALVKFDRDLESEALTEDLLGLAWSMNRDALRAEGLGVAQRPRFEIVSQMRRDPGSAASAISTLLNAGVRGFRQDEVFEVMGFTPCGPFDQALKIEAPAGAGVATAPEEKPAGEKPSPEPSPPPPSTPPE